MLSSKTYCKIRNKIVTNTQKQLFEWLQGRTRTVAWDVSPRVPTRERPYIAQFQMFNLKINSRALAIRVRVDSGSHVTHNCLCSNNKKIESQHFRLLFNLKLNKALRV